MPITRMPARSTSTTPRINNPLQRSITRISASYRRLTAMTSLSNVVTSSRVLVSTSQIPMLIKRGIYPFRAFLLFDPRLGAITPRTYCLSVKQLIYFLRLRYILTLTCDAMNVNVNVPYASIPTFQILTSNPLKQTTLPNPSECTNTRQSTTWPTYK